MTADPATLIEARSLQVGYRGHAVLPTVDLSVRSNEFWLVVGRNGAGKSTVLKTLVGLLRPVGGSVERRIERIGYVPQRSAIDLTVPSRVIDLVREGADLRWSFLNPAARRRSLAMIERAIDATSIRPLLRRSYASLSEGQKQRVLIARAIACTPDLLVLDEPTSAMDHHAEHAVFELLDDLRASYGLTVMLVTHHLCPATRRATHAIFVDAEDGIVRIGPWSDVRSDRTFVHRYGSVVDEGTALHGAA